MTPTERADETSVSDEGFAAFLEKDTNSTVSATTFGAEWNGVQAITVRQGDDAFTSPPLESHFVAMCTDGTGIVDIAFDAHAGPSRSLVEPGTLCFMPAGQQTTFEMVGWADMTHVLIRDDMMQSALRLSAKGDPARIFPDGFSGRHHSAINATMHRIGAGTRTGGALWADAMALELARRIVEYAGSVTRPEGVGMDLSDLQFCHAIDYIEANLTRDFTLSELAAAVGVPPERMAHGFRAEAGTTVEMFRTDRRIGIVRSWLKSEKTPYDIGRSGTAPDDLGAMDVTPHDLGAMARRVGFEDARALDAAFREVLGISVANYRAGRFG